MHSIPWQRLLRSVDGNHFPACEMIKLSCIYIHVCYLHNNMYMCVHGNTGCRTLKHHKLHAKRFCMLKTFPNSECSQKVCCSSEEITPIHGILFYSFTAAAQLRHTGVSYRIDMLSLECSGPIARLHMKTRLKSGFVM